MHHAEMMCRDPAEVLQENLLNLEFVPMREPGSFFAADAAVVEDTWSLEPDVCVKGRFHPNQHFRSTTVEALERSDAAGPRVTA